LRPAGPEADRQGAGRRLRAAGCQHLKKPIASRQGVSRLEAVNRRMFTLTSLSGAPALLALAALSWPLWLAAASYPAAPQLGPHGAAQESLQLERLAELFPRGLSLAAPAQIEAGVWARSFPRGVVPSAAQVELGQALYFDPRLSGDGTVSCATCHDVTRAFADRRPVSEGIGGQFGRRNAPTVMNAALLEPLFWDGRATHAEHQAVLPFLNPVEMGVPSEAALVDLVRAIPAYQSAFEGLYVDGVTLANLGHAIGAFERTLIFLDAPFDRFLAGDLDAISPQARAGWELFRGSAGCSTCHPISAAWPLGTDQLFHNLGVSSRPQQVEALAEQARKALASEQGEGALDRLALATDLSALGRFMVTKQGADIGAFKTPQLRNVGITQPYMHDGSVITLWDVIDHLNRGGGDTPYLDAAIQPLGLGEVEIDQLVAFLFTLTDRRFAEFNQSAYESQRERALLRRPLRDAAR
jgi:cytochrome c peroxidase